MLTEPRHLAPWGILALALVLAACETTPTNSGQVTSNVTSDPGRNTNPAIAARPVPVEANPLAVGNGADRVFFALDRHDLNDQSRAVVAKWGEYLRTQPNKRFVIEGHADERGTREYNLALADKRAIAVREYLLTMGVRPSQLQTVSYGKERPAVPGSSEQAWSQNRRAVALLE